jgi:curved DNA-binding protein CbpA
MGVTPDATQVVIKRIVDGLRLNWHPDHAKDEPDRQMRELRLKQINAAWDILNGVRAEA